MKKIDKIRRKSIDNNDRIIVSFTSYPARINLVPRVLESLYAQSQKADKIVLWLAREQFPNLEKDLPDELIKDKNDNKFELRWCDDLGSHKKYFYAMQEFSEDIIITTDDDMIYHPDTIKTLYELHCKFPRTVASIYAKMMFYDDNYDLLPYRDWLYNIVLPVPSMQIIPMGSGGVLYPPHVLDEGVFDKNTIINKLKYNGVICDDDIWLKTHSLLAGVPTVTQAEYLISNQVIPTNKSIGTLDTTNQQQHNLLASELAFLKSSDGKRSIKDVLMKAREKGDYYDFNSPVVKERTYQFVLDKLNIKIQKADLEYITYGYLHYTLSFFNTAMSYGDIKLSKKYISKLKEDFLNIPNIDELTNKSKFVDALLKYDVVILEQLNIWHRQPRNYYQMLDNWKDFLKLFTKDNVPHKYKYSYMNFLKNMYSFSRSINKEVYSAEQIKELRKTIKVNWKQISFIERIKFIEKVLEKKK